MQTVLVIGVGGFVGANARYFIGTWVLERLTTTLGWSFQYGTLFVNVTGSVLLALFTVWASQQVDVSQDVKLLIATGFFGAYTTFSTFANESIAYLRDGQPSLFLLNVILTNILCLVGVLIGIWLGHRLWVSGSM